MNNDKPSDEYVCKFKQHDFDWDKSQLCMCCGMKERDYLEGEVQTLKALLLEAKNVMEGFCEQSGVDLDDVFEWKKKVRELMEGK